MGLNSKASMRPAASAASCVCRQALVAAAAAVLGHKAAAAAGGCDEAPDHSRHREVLDVLSIARHPPAGSAREARGWAGQGAGRAGGLLTWRQCEMTMLKEGAFPQATVMHRAKPSTQWTKCCPQQTGRAGGCGAPEARHQPGCHNRWILCQNVDKFGCRRTGKQRSQARQ